MNTITKRYRVDGDDEYTMEYREKYDGTFEVVATDCPDDPYGNGPATHHRYDSGRICVAAGREPRTLDRAIAIASVWMKRYSAYCRSGRFDSSGSRVDV